MLMAAFIGATFFFSNNNTPVNLVTLASVHTSIPTELKVNREGESHAFDPHDLSANTLLRCE